MFSKKYSLPDMFSKKYMYSLLPDMSSNIILSAGHVQQYYTLCRTCSAKKLCAERLAKINTLCRTCPAKYKKNFSLLDLLYYTILKIV